VSEFLELVCGKLDGTIRGSSWQEGSWQSSKARIELMCDCAILSFVKPKQATVRCQITGRDVPLDDATPADLVRSSLVPYLQRTAGSFDPSGYVSLEAVNKARMEHFLAIVDAEEGDLRDLQQEVAKSLELQETISSQTGLAYDSKASMGQRVADKVAKFGGSWAFIGTFGGILVVWIILNTLALSQRAFDPYPFILLNLILSCVAAMQAPVIMMSQNRQEDKDRLRSENDYKVNLKAELEIRHLHEKIDRLLNDQWKHLLEIQQMQMEMIEDSSKGKENGFKRN
jgi:uncharacterized membrane protein